MPKLLGIELSYKRRISVQILELRVYLEGQEDLASTLINPITHIVTPVIPIILTYLLNPPGPPSRDFRTCGLEGSGGRDGLR